MHAHDACRPARAVAYAATALVIALTLVHGPATGQSQPKTRHAAAAPAKDEGDEHPLKGGQAIVVLVNDEPITAYEIEQRALLIALNSGGAENMRARLEARWQQIVKDPKTNERFQQLLREKNVRTKEEAMALQKQFAVGLQKNLVEQLHHEDRANKLPQFRKQAREELIEEHLKIQEAKR